MTKHAKPILIDKGMLRAYVYRGIDVEIKNWKSSTGRTNWAFYVYRDPNPVFQALKGPTESTYHELQADGRSKIGWDYQHLWQLCENYKLSQILKDAIKCVDSILDGPK